MSDGGIIVAGTKSQEVTLRRRAARHGLRLVRSRRRDPMAPDYGLYWLLPADDITPNTVHSGLKLADAITLAEVEQRLKSQP